MTNTQTQNQKKWLKPFGSVYSFAIYLAAVALFVGGLIVVLAAERDNTQFLVATLIGMFAVCQVPILLRLALKLKLPLFFDIYIVFGTFGHAAGHIFGWYDAGWHWDKVLHIAAGVSFTLIGFSFVPLIAKNIKVADKKQVSIVFMLLFAIGFSTTIALLWEILEFILDSTLGLNAQRWQDGLRVCENGGFYYQYIDGIRYYFTSVPQGTGLIDTMWDMIWHLIGSIAICIILFILIKKRKTYKGLFVEELINKDKKELESEKLGKRIISKDEEKIE